VPTSVADRIFSVCGGGSASSASSNGTAAASGFSIGAQNRGLSFKDTLTVLVLLTRGTNEEKTKCKKMFSQKFGFRIQKQQATKLMAKTIMDNDAG
jgi:hypothetical protein